MTWLSKEEIERIKREVNILQVFRSHGFEFTKHGQNFKTHCFLHNDTNPSLVVSPKKNLWNCLGCGEGGSVFDFLMKYHQISFRDALDKLNGNGTGDHQTLPNKENITDAATKQKLLQRVVEYYFQTMHQEQDAANYLTKRGIYSPEAINTFHIGYANRTLSTVIPRDSEMRQALLDLGIFNPKTGHELFAGSVVFPIIDDNGLVTEMYARKIGDKLRKETPLHLFLPGPHRGVWNAKAFTASDFIILCESAIDALTFWVNGLRNVTFSYGTSGFTDDHLQLMKANRTKLVYCAYDNDDAGNKAAVKLAERLAKEGITTYRMQFPKGMDANEYALKVTPANKSLAVLFKDPPVIGGQETSVSLPQPVKDDPKKNDLPVDKPDQPPLAVTTKKESDPVITELKKKITMKKQRGGIYFTIGDRTYRVRGLEKNKSYEVMKVSIRAATNGSYFLDTLDLVQDRQRRIFVKNAADELEVVPEIIKRDVGNILLLLEELHEEILEQSLDINDDAYLMTEAEQNAALRYLQAPDLIKRIMSDFHTCGIVNEDMNLLVGYLATISRKFDDPLAIMFQSSPGSGKSTVMDAILDFVPEEDKRVFTYMTGQSLFYSGENDLVNKVLAIEEDEGAENAIYSLKTMQSEKRISIQSTGTDPSTGRNKSFTAVVNGPMCIFICTTKPFVDEEFMLRFLCLGADESKQQTMAVLKRQRENETLEGMLRKEQAKHLKHQHRNIQRLLQPIRVLNPYAGMLTFPSNNLRTRRDQIRFLTLIRAIAFLFQYQRDKKLRKMDGVPTEYIEVVPTDIKLAYKLSCEVMGRTLDELAPQTRNLLNMLVDMVHDECERHTIEREDYRFGQKGIRTFTGWSAYQVKIHMKRLVDLEYVYCHKSRRGRLFEYELVYDGEGESGKPFVLGIANIDNLVPLTEPEKTSTTKVGVKKSMVGVG